MRPTGRLHIGHYFGALQNWRALQDKIDPKTGQPEYDCYFPVVDWHALTTHYEDTASIAENTLQVTMDWLSVGLDPVKSTLFIQSRVLEHAELHLILSMITPLGWLERVPTYKEIIENLKDRDLGTYGFLGYPLLQSADIVLYGEPGRELLVPVGEDQVPHIELAREIVRRFNTHYGFQIDDEKLWKAAENDAATLNEELGLSLRNSSDVPQSAWDHPATFRHILDPVVNQALRRRVLEEGFQNFVETRAEALLDIDDRESRAAGNPMLCSRKRRGCREPTGGEWRRVTATSFL